jgi:hypothetical protein
MYHRKREINSTPNACMLVTRSTKEISKPNNSTFADTDDCETKGWPIKGAKQDSRD